MDGRNNEIPQFYRHFLAEALDNVGTTLFNSIAVIFGMEQTDSVGGSNKQILYGYVR